MLGAVLALGPAACPAGARTPAAASFSVAPASPTPTGYFILPGRPGATLHAAVRVVNTGRRAGRATLFAVDAATAERSGAVYLPANAPRRDVGRWISLASTSVRVGAGQSTVIPYRVAIPRGVANGQHLGGVVVADAAVRRTLRKGAKGSFRLNVKTLSIVAVEVNLPGTVVKKVAPTGVRPAGQAGVQTVELRLRNDGNQLIKPHGALTIASSGGHRLRFSRFVLDTFLPRSTISYPVAVPHRALPPGSYRATVKIQYGPTATFPFTISDQNVKQVFGPHRQGAPGTSAPSTLLIVLIAIGALIIGFLGAALAFRSRGRRPPPT